NNGPRKSPQVQRILALRAGDITDFDVSHRGRKIPGVSLFIIEVDGDDRLLHLPNCHVPHINALDHAAPLRVALQPESPIELRTVHPAAIDEDVARTAGNFAADGHAAVSILHDAVTDDDILYRRCKPPAIVVAAGLERDAIIAGVERTFFDQN